MENEGTTTLSLRDLFYILFKHKVTILVLFFSIILTIFVGVYILPEKYEARATLLIKLGRENISTSAVPPTSSQQVITAGLRKEDIISEIEILSNRFIIEKVVNFLGTDFLFPKPVKPETFFKIIKYELKQAIFKIKDFIYEILYILDLKKKLSPFEMVVTGIQKSLSAKQISDSDVIEVQLKWSNPDIAKEIVSTLIDSYLVKHLEAHKTSGAYEFLEKQVDIMGGELGGLEDRLQRLKERQGITSYEGQIKLLLENITLFNTSLKNTQTEITETITKVSELKNQLSLQPETIQLTKEINRNPLIDPLKTKLLELELEKNKLEKKYTDDSRPVISITQEIKKVKARLEEEATNVGGAMTTGVNTTFKETQKELLLQEVYLRALNEKKKMLEEHIKSYTNDLERLNKSDVELKRLNRQMQIQEENYQLYRKKLEEARISEVQDRERMVNVRVIEPANSSFSPVRPKKLLIIGMGMVLSLFFGIGLAFVSEYLDHSVKSAEDVKKYLNLPLLGSIKEVKN